MTTSKTENTKVSLIPHLEKPGVADKISQALEKRNYADYQCFQMLERLLDSTPTTELAKLYATFNAVSIEEAYELLDTCCEIIQNRKDASDEFLRAISGR